MSSKVNVVSPEGKVFSVDAAEVEGLRGQGFELEGGEQAAARVIGEQRESQYGGLSSKIASAGAGALRTVTGGLSDAGMVALGGEDARRELSALKEVNPTETLIGEIGGAVLPVGLPGRAASIGRGIAATGEGATVATQLGRSALGYGVEGGIQGIGAGVSEVALSDQPLTLEQVASTLSSNMLYGGAAGAGVGVASKGLELGLGKARTAIQKFRAQGDAVDSIPDDLAQMDAKQLRAARDAEIETIKTAQKIERETIEAARVGERKTIADDIAGHRASTQTEKAWLATKESADAEIRTIGKQAIKADNQLRNLLDNPKYLAEKPQQALAALQKQEHVFEEMLRVEPKLRATFAADTTGARAAALDTVPAALERNRALQARIRGVTSEIKVTTPDASPRLQQIDTARDVLASGGGKQKSIAEQMLAGSVFSGVASMTAAVPGVGGMLAPFLGARASKLVSEGVFGQANKAASGVAKRGANAVSRFLDASHKVAKSAPPVSTSVLASVRFAPSASKERTGKTRTDLAALFKARSAELRSQTMYGPDGTPQLRPEARQAMADRLAPIAALDPLAADKLETLAARRLEFLASKLPRKPDIGGLPTSAADQWQPSDMEMRKFARYVAGVEDPIGIVERLAAGSVTPEDTEVMRTVYPEMHADITRQIVEQLPSLRTSLPFHRRLALSVFTGAPVVAAMEPRILRVLQRQHAAEEGTEGGIQAPTPQPQFGSVSREKPTPAQERSS